MWRVDGRVYRDVDLLVEDLITEDSFDDEDYIEESVNEAYGSIEIAGETFEAYDILHDMNEYLLDDVRSDFIDNWVETERDDAKYELERLDPGETVYIHGSYVECIDEEEEPEEEVYVDPTEVSKEDDTAIRSLFDDFQKI